MMEDPLAMGLEVLSEASGLTTPVGLATPVDFGNPQSQPVTPEQPIPPLHLSRTCDAANVDTTAPVVTSPPAATQTVGATTSVPAQTVSTTPGNQVNQVAPPVLGRPAQAPLSLLNKPVEDPDADALEEVRHNLKVLSALNDWDRLDSSNQKLSVAPFNQVFQGARRWWTGACRSKDLSRIGQVFEDAFLLLKQLVDARVRKYRQFQNTREQKLAIFENKQKTSHLLDDISAAHPKLESLKSTYHDDRSMRASVSLLRETVTDRLQYFRADLLIIEKSAPKGATVHIHNLGMSC